MKYGFTLNYFFIFFMLLPFVVLPQTDEIKVLSKQSGFSNITELTFGMYLKEFSEAHTNFGGYNYYPGKYLFNLQNINGYQFNPYFNLGLGVGLNQIGDFHNLGGTLSLSLDTRINFNKKSLSPFFETAGGYSFQLMPVTKEGILLITAIGIRNFISTRSTINLTIGNRIQWYNHYLLKGFYDFITFNFGLNF